MPDELTTLPLTNPLEFGDPEELDVFWAGWREYAQRYGGLPPLQDSAIRALAQLGKVPDWLLDKWAVINRLGGEAYAAADALPVPPPDFGYIVKPRRNPNGLAVEVRRSEEGRDRSAEEIAQPYYRGEAISVDYAVRDGHILWGIVARGAQTGRGRFSEWRIERARANPAINVAAQTKFEKALPGYSGMLNVEAVLIGQRLPRGHTANRWGIIEAHFRPSPEFFPLYGEAAVTAIVDAARGYAPEQGPEVSGGILQLQPHGARCIDTIASLGEWSWRRRLIYSDFIGW